MSHARLPRHLLAVTLVASMLAACGGGGGGDPGTGNPPPGGGTASYDVAAAWRNLLTTSNSWQVSGGASSDGVNHTITVTYAPGATMPFPRNGQQGATTVQSLSISRPAPQPPLSTVARVYLDPATYLIFGVEAGTSCSVVTSSALPATPQAVGASGPLYTRVQYNDCTLAGTQVATATSTWSLNSVGGIVYFCAHTTLQNGGNSGSESDCVQVAENGTLGAKARVSIELSNGFKVTDASN